MNEKESHALINTPASHRQQLAPASRTLLVCPIRMQEHLPNIIHPLLAQPPIRNQRQWWRNTDIRPLSPWMSMSPWMALAKDEGSASEGRKGRRKMEAKSRQAASLRCWLWLTAVIPLSATPTPTSVISTEAPMRTRTDAVAVGLPSVGR